MDDSILFSDSIKKIDNYMCYPDEYLCSQLSIPIEQLRDYNNWIKMDNEWYYLKPIWNSTQILNELIGVKLAAYFKIESIKYQIVKAEQLKNYLLNVSDYALASKNFREKDYEYYRIADLDFYFSPFGLDNVHELRKHCSDERNYKKLALSLMKMGVLDFYSAQTDRHCDNYYFKKKNNELALAPLFDYESSFYNSSSDKFSNGLVNLKDSDYYFRILFEECNGSYDILKSVLDIDLEGILNNIEKEYNITITEGTKSDYLSFDKKRKNLVKETLKRIQ